MTTDHGGVAQIYKADNNDDKAFPLYTKECHIYIYIYMYIKINSACFRGDYVFIWTNAV